LRGETKCTPSKVTVKDNPRDVEYHSGGRAYVLDSRKRHE